jgi:hypothetical protein
VLFLNRTDRSPDQYFGSTDRARLRLQIAILAAISEAVAAMVMAFDVRAPLVIYNASGSAPLGFYYVENRLPTRGELALITPPARTTPLGKGNCPMENPVKNASHCSNS